MDIVGCITVDRGGSGDSSQPLQRAAYAMTAKGRKSTAYPHFVLWQMRLFLKRASLLVLLSVFRLPLGFPNGFGTALCAASRYV